MVLSEMLSCSSYLSSDFALFIALAILLKEKDHLINPKYDFSDIPLVIITQYHETAHAQSCSIASV